MSAKKTGNDAGLFLSRSAAPQGARSSLPAAARNDAQRTQTGQEQGLNDSTIRTQYARWRAFHGITGRVTIPTPAAPAAPAEQAAQ